MTDAEALMVALFEELSKKYKKEKSVQIERGENDKKGLPHLIASLVYRTKHSISNETAWISLEDGAKSIRVHGRSSYSKTHTLANPSFDPVADIHADIEAIRAEQMMWVSNLEQMISAAVEDGLKGLTWHAETRWRNGTVHFYPSGLDHDHTPYIKVSPDRIELRTQGYYGTYFAGQISPRNTKRLKKALYDVFVQQIERHGKKQR